MEVIVMSERVQEYKGIRYYKCGFYFQRKGVRLHRKVWEDAHGPVTVGYAVHHIDGNRSNNDINNLMTMEKSKHSERHMADPVRKEIARANIQAAIAKAPEWHASESGKTWHGIQAKETWRKREASEHICTHCGKSFMTNTMYHSGGNTFCGPNCRSAHRRESGIDDIQKICEMCGNKYISNRYAKRRFCDGCKNKSHSVRRTSACLQHGSGGCAQLRDTGRGCGS